MGGGVWAASRLGQGRLVDAHARWRVAASVLDAAAAAPSYRSAAVEVA